MADKATDKPKPSTREKAASRPELIACGEMGILFADLSGYTQLVYLATADEKRLERLAIAMFRLFADATADFPDVRIDGYAGDGFLALSGGKTPVRTLYLFARALHQRFSEQVRSLLLDLGFRASVFLRTGLHVGPVWRMRLPGPGDGNQAAGIRDQQGAGAAAGDTSSLIVDPSSRTVCISDAINLASRVVTGQMARRTGLAVTRDCYRRLMRAGRKDIRDPDEVIQDRNQYPEPVQIYRILPAEHEAIMQRLGAGG